MTTTMNVDPPLLDSQDAERERADTLTLDQARGELAAIRAEYGHAGPFALTLRTDALNRRIANLRYADEARERKQGLLSTLQSSENPIVQALSDEQKDAVAHDLSGLTHYES